MIGFECTVVDLFGWSLREIDETDIETLIPFVFEYPKWKSGNRTLRKQLYADQLEL